MTRDAAVDDAVLDVLGDVRGAHEQHLDRRVAARERERALARLLLAEAGVLGPEYTEKADPATVSFIPRPDWYFYFLFYLLRIFEWPATVVLATVGIPTICSGVSPSLWRSRPNSQRAKRGASSRRMQPPLYSREASLSS